MPVVGLVEGVVNYKIIRKIGRYAKLKYKKRYLYKKTRDIINKDLNYILILKYKAQLSVSKSESIRKKIHL